MVSTIVTMNGEEKGSPCHDPLLSVVRSRYSLPAAILIGGH